MISPSLGLSDNIRRIAGAGVVKAGRKVVEIGQIFIGVVVMWGILIVAAPLAAFDRVKKQLR